MGKWLGKETRPSAWLGWEPNKLKKKKNSLFSSVVQEHMVRLCRADFRALLIQVDFIISVKIGSSN